MRHLSSSGSIAPRAAGFNLKKEKSRGTENGFRARKGGFVFFGKTSDGWMTLSGKPKRKPIEQGDISPHRCDDHSWFQAKLPARWVGTDSDV